MDENVFTFGKYKHYENNGNMEIKRYFNFSFLLICFGSIELDKCTYIRRKAKSMYIIFVFMENIFQ